LFKKTKTSEPRTRKSYRRAPIANYYRAAKTTGTPSPFRRREPKTNRRVILFNIADIILLVIVIIGLIYSLILRGDPAIKADGSEYHNSEVYKSQIAPLFSGFRNSNKLTFDESSVVNAIQTRFPEVRSARVELPFFSEQPVVWLDISPPAFTLVNDQNSYLIDTQGVAVAKSADIPAIRNQVTVQDQTGFKVQVGQQVLSSDGVGLLNTVIAQAKQAKVPISSLSLPPRAQELDLKTSDQPYYVKFYLAGDALNQTGQFLAARHQFAKSGKSPAQYLDVRVPGKIFYK
jgi:hypothetical protein